MLPTPEFAMRTAHGDRSRITDGHDATADAVRAVRWGAMTLAGSVLLDSSIEHYRGGFRHRAMFIPLATSGLSLALNGAAPSHGRRTGGGSPARRIGHGTVALSGAMGLGFHARNLIRQVGGIGWNNLFHGAPVGAPGALILAGTLGVAADRLAERKSAQTDDANRLAAARTLGGLAAAGIVATTAEAWLLHFRGAFHHPAMLLPVTVPPLAAGLLARDAWRGHATHTTRTALIATGVVGCLGSALHAWGVSRRMGGWRNWSQNLLAGPPIPAPPAFTGLAIAALGALALMGGQRPARGDTWGIGAHRRRDRRSHHHQTDASTVWRKDR